MSGIETTTNATPGRIALDDVDRRMLVELQRDGRLSVNELAARVNVSRATAYARFDRLRATGVISGFTAIVDPAKLGAGVTALIMINVEQAGWREARDRLLDLEGLDYLAFTSGSFDLVALVRVTDMHTLRDVILEQLHGMAEIRSTQTVFVLDETRLIPPRIGR